VGKQKNKQKGELGEGVAVNYLVKKGYRVLERNYRCRYGEIDIIAKKNDNLIFVEVKTKTSDFFGAPEEMVDDCKLEKINNTIDYFMGERKGGDEINIRVDVIAVKIDRRGRLESIKHIENFS